MFDGHDNTEVVRDALASHLRAELEDSELRLGPLEPFGDGHSGYTYRVAVESGSCRGPHVLRLSPPEAKITGPADIGRQGRIMAALGRAGLPVPPVAVFNSAPVVAGRSFALMGFVDGASWSETVGAANDREVAAAAVDFLHQLHGVAPADTGLADEIAATPTSELGRWCRLLERAPTSLHSAGGNLATALAEQLPSPGPACLVHGDYHYGNLLFAWGHRPARIVAVVDWEIAGLGPPLMDLGSLAVASLRRRYRPEPNPTGNVAIGVAELVDLYGSAASEDRFKTTWYLALSCLKYAAILGYNLGLHRSGRRPDPIYEQLTTTMHGLIADGRDLLAGKEIV